LQADEQPSVIDRGVEAGGAHRRTEARYGWIGEDDVHRLFLQLLHGLERNVGRGDRAAEDEPGVVRREKALWRLDVERDGKNDGGDERHQRERAMLDDVRQCAVVEADQTSQY